MTDVEDGATLVGETPQGLKKLVSLLGGKDRGRFIHYQQPGVLQQTANGFYPLFLANREGVDVGVRIELQAVFCRNRPDTVIKTGSCHVFGYAQGNVFTHGHRFKKSAYCCWWESHRF